MREGKSVLAQYFVFVHIPRTKVEALRKGPSRRDEVRDRAIYRAKERGARYNVEAGGISTAWPIPRPMFTYR